LHKAAARTGTNDTRLCIDLGFDANALPERCDAIGLEQRCGFYCKAFKPGTRGRPRNRRKNDSGKQTDYREDANDFEQDVAVLPPRNVNATR
jgi:hypothetical protein